MNFPQIRLPQGERAGFVVRKKITDGGRRWRFSASRRPGRAFIVAAVGVSGAAVLAILTGLAWSRSRDRGLPDVVTTAAWKGPYEYVIIEPGNIESASSVEVKSEVRSRGGTTTIIEVIPEGTFVNAGDTLVQLDTSGLEEEETTQKILIATRKSLLAEAENTLAAAKIAKTEYLEGTFITQEQLLESTRFTAEQAKETAASAYESAKRLYAQAIYGATQVEAAYNGLEEAANVFDAADTALSTLRNLTKPKDVALLDANIASAEANVQAQSRSLRLEEERLAFIQEQIVKCTIRAPSTGQVVYANETDPYRNSGSQFIVTPGATVRERQTIIWLPNPRDMQVRATVNEARITMVRPGLPVTIRVTALGDQMLEGQVTRVNQYAEPSQSSSMNIKRYTTFIKINNPPGDLRVGMQAEARIHVERTPEALQVPVQALAEYQGRYYSIVKEGDDYETREVQIGSANDKVAMIAGGLGEGDEVVMNPRSLGDLLDLPGEGSAPLAKTSGHNRLDGINSLESSKDEASEKNPEDRTGGGE